MSPPLRGAVLGILLAFGTSPLARAQGGAVPSGVRVLKIAHQFPGGTADAGDFRDRLCRKFAAEVERRTNGTLRFEIYPENKLIRPEDYVDAFQKSAMDFCLTPMNNLFARIPEVAVAQLPAVIRDYEQAMRWKIHPAGQDLAAALDKNGAIIVTWVWEASGIISLVRPVVLPDDVRDLRVRGGGKGIDSIFSAAGAKMLTMPSSDIRPAFQEHRLDVAVSASTSLVAFHLEQFCRAVTTPRNRSIFYFFAPLMISKATLQSLTPEQRRIVMEVGAALEKFALEAVKADDEMLARAYLASNAAVYDLDEDQWLLWQRFAKAAAWHDYERSVPDGAQRLQRALAVP
jgi:TRAP-type C4-dicarboxylate transport system substrate-binding protein